MVTPVRRFPSIWYILALALALWGGEYLLRDLWEPDEARYAYVAREMRDTGNWAVPHRHGEYYAHKPPLMFWLINASALFTGGEINRVATRLPSLLGAVLSLWAIAGIARRWTKDPDTAWRTILVTMTTYLFWNKGGMGQIDALLTGFELLALYHLIAYEDDRRLWRPLLAYTSMGCAILAKGPVGFIVPFGMYIASTFAARDGTRRRFAHIAWGPLLVLLLPGAWLAWVYTHHPPPGYLQELLFKQNVGRAAGEMGHQNPFYFYLIHFPLEFLPWTPLWFCLRAAYRALPAQRPAFRRLLALIVFDVLFFSLSPSKRELYILAAYPPMALLVAMAWPTLSARASTTIVRFWTAFLGISGLAISAIVTVDALMHLHRLPFDGTPLFVPAALAILGAALLHQRHRTEGGRTDKIFFTLFATMFTIQIAVGTIVYAAANTLKAPYTVAAAAAQHLAPHEPLLLYRENFEIMALYANRPGESVDTPQQLEKILRARGHGLFVMKASLWPELTDTVKSHALRQEFRMGHKNLAWVYVDFRGP